MLKAVRYGLKISAEVRQALHEKRGVVALESTVITHGLPHPLNESTAKKLEAEVRSNGAVPATIAIIDGGVHVGLEEAELARIAEPDFKALKVSTRDIPVATAKKSNGGTTVAATMFLANMAGIRVFATGGIGGVHRGAEQTFDISADLIELSRTPVAVVCAGVKSILDIGKTLEYMETHGVGVIVHGNSTNFPGFFVPKTEFKAPYHSQSLKTIASILEQGRSLAMQNGTVIACPIPSEYAANAQAIEDAIQEALLNAKAQNIASKEVTPFILQRVNELTKGASVGTNVQLLRNNAAIGAKLARILAEQSREKDVRESRVVAAPSSNQEEPKEENNAEEKPKKKWRKNRNKKPKVVS